MALPKFVDGAINRCRNFFIDQIDNSDLLTVSQDEARAFQAKYTADNAKLADQCDGLNADHLEPDYGRYPEEGNLHRIGTPLECSDHMAEIVTRFKVALWLERAEKSIVQHELHLARNQSESAEEAIKNAAKCLKNAEQGAFEDQLPQLQRCQRQVKRYTRRLKR